MLDLLETLRNLLLSGQEPAPFLIAVQHDGGVIMISASDPSRELIRVRNHYGSIAMAFAVKSTSLSGGRLLEVIDLASDAGYVLSQFCRKTSGGYEAAPYCWRAASFARASSAYQRTSGLIPNWGSVNSCLLNQRIC